DHPQHHHDGFGAAGPLRRPVHGAAAFLAVIDNDEVFALVAPLEAAALAAHVAPRGARSAKGATARRAATSGPGLAADKADDVFDGSHRFGGHPFGPCAAVRQHAVDM